MQNDTIESSSIFLLCMSCWNIVSYSYLFYKEICFAPEIHPVTLLALSSVLYIGVNGISLFMRMIGGEIILFAGNEVNNVLLLGLWYLNLQHILFLTTYYHILHRHKIHVIFSYLITHNNIPYKKWALRTYLCIWIFRIIDLIINLNMYSSFLRSISNKAQLVTLTLLMFVMLTYPSDKKIKKIYWLITAIEIIRVLGNGSKQEIISNLIPYFLYLLIGYKIGIVKFDKRLFTTLGVLSIFIIFVVFPYVSVFRDISVRKNITWSEVSVTEAIS